MACIASGLFSFHQIQGIYIMKPANFPARKLARQIRAKGELLSSHENALEQARSIRTKKDRSSKLRSR